MQQGIVGNTAGAFTSTLYQAKLILGTNQFAPGKTLALAGITQPTYTGYAAIVITWGTTTYDTNGLAVSFGQLATFKATGGTPATTVYGYGIMDNAGANLLGMDLFVAPMSIVDLFGTINIVPVWPLQVIQSEVAVAFQ